MNKYINCIITGALLGTAVGVMVLPQLNKRTQKKIKRMCNNLMCPAKNSYIGLKNKYLK